MQYSKAFIDYVLANVKEATPTAGILDGASVKLYQNNYTPNFGSVADDFTEADFDGYTPGGVVLGWTGPVNEGSNQRKLVSESVTFTMSGDTTPNTVYGYYIVSSGGDDLIASRRFDEPISMVSAGSNATVVVGLPLVSSVGNVDMVDADA